MKRSKDGGEPPAPNGKRRNQFDVQGHLYRMTGVDLTRIDGVDAYTALKVISEVGTDMTKWPSAKHFASWPGAGPNNRITGGRVIRTKARQPCGGGAAAGGQRLHRSGSALGAFLRRKKAHLGAPKAITATAHNWPVSSTPCCAADTDTWTEYYQYRQRALHTARRRAAQLGYHLVPITDVHTLDTPNRSDQATA